MTQPHNTGAPSDVRTGDELKASLSKPDPLLKRIWAQPEGKVGMILTLSLIHI